MKWTFLIPPILVKKREVERVFGCTYKLYPIPNIFMLYGASVVCQVGHTVSFIDAPLLKWRKSNFIKYIQRDFSDVYVFYTVNLAKENDLAAAKIIKSYKPNAWIIFTGPSPTYEPEDYLYTEKIVIIRGEMEDIIALLANILTVKGEIDYKALELCNGISYCLKREVKHNPKIGIISDIDKLPLPARNLVNKNRYFSPKLGVIPFTALLTSRGCSFHCRYCVPNSLSFARELEFRKGLENWEKPKVTIRSFENVYDELIYLKKNGYKAISIIDDQFVWVGDREIRIAEALGSLGFVWGCLSRADMITEDIAHTFGKNNCRYVDLGIESFCQNILDDVRKGTTVEKQKRGIELLKKYNVPVKLNILLGASHLETDETIEYTLSIASKIAPDSIMVSICNSFPGTEFWEVAKREKWLTTCKYKPVDVQKESTISYPHLHKNKLEKAVKKANIKFFLNPQFILKNIVRIKNPITLMKIGKVLLKKFVKAS